MVHVKLCSYLCLASILSACAQQPTPEIIPEITYNKLGEAIGGACVGGGGTAGTGQGDPCIPPNDGGCTQTAGTANCLPPPGNQTGRIPTPTGGGQGAQGGRWQGAGAGAGGTGGNP